MSAPEEWEYTWEGRGGPFTILLAPSVFAPTYTSKEVAESIVVKKGETVIDVGCGSGVLSFVAARLGAGRVYGTDANEDAIAIARRNAEKLGLEGAVDLRAGSLFEPLHGIQADVVIGDVSGVPDDIAAVSDWFDPGRGCRASGGSQDLRGRPDAPTSATVASPADEDLGERRGAPADGLRGGQLHPQGKPAALGAADLGVHPPALA